MRFLVIRFSSLGDIITTTAFLSALRSMYPESEIHYATKEEFSEILKSQPFVDNVFALERGQPLYSFAKSINLKFDCVFDLHKNPRSILLSILIKKKRVKRINKHTLYRWKLLHPKALFFIRERETLYNIDDQLKLIGADESFKPVLHVDKHPLPSTKPVIGMAPGARWETKRWPEENFKKLAGMLTEKGFSVALFGSENEKEIAQRVKNGYKGILDFTGKLSILQTAQRMKSCILMVTNDSAAMHMAVALDIPVVAIFGPTVREFGFFPKSNLSRVVENRELACRPCSLHGTDKCPLGSHECMRSITPERVLEAIEELLEERNGSR